MSRSASVQCVGSPRVGQMLSVVVVVIVVALVLLVTEAQARATKRGSGGGGVSEGDNPHRATSLTVSDNSIHVVATDSDDPDDLVRPEQSKLKLAQTSPSGLAVAEVLNRLDVLSENKYSDSDDDEDKDNNAHEVEDDWGNDFDDSEEEEEEDDEDDYDWSNEELEEVRQKILDGLGLTTAPTRAKANVTQEEYNTAYAGYLEAVRQEEGRYRNQDQLQPSSDLAESDYTFYSTGAEHHHPGRRGRRSTTSTEGQLVHFHVAVPVKKVYDHDELNVVKATAKFWKTGSALSETNESQETVRVKFYRVDYSSRRRRRSHRKKEAPIFLNSVDVSVSGDEWISSDVSSAVQHWLQKPETGAGILIQCEDCAAAGINIHTASATNSTLVPTLDVRTQIPASKRVKRSQMSNVKWKRHSDCKRPKRNGRGRSKCCRRSMKVNFDKLPNFDFIVSPNEFDAYYCTGRCPARYNPANEHALLQSLINLKHKKQFPGPCCAPTELSGLAILHFNNENKLVTTTWRGMVVESCGCA